MEGFRFYPAEVKKVSAAKPVSIQIPKDQEYKLVIEAAETGVSIDRLVIKQTE